MYLVPASGGFPERLAPLLDTECCGAWPHFLPDGRHFLYTVARSDTSACGIYIGEIGNPHGRVDGFAPGGRDGGAKNPFWSPDNPTIAFFYGAANRGRGPAGRRGSDRTPERGYFRPGAVWSGVVTLGRSAMIRMLRKWI
jgi:Tol biopolymer transport system component